MSRAMTYWFSTAGLMPHGHCYLWQPSLVWLHVVSDGLIALAYFAISATLLRLIRKRTDLPFDWIFLCFSVFIVACGLTHAMEIWTLWRPDYWVSGMVKVLTAAASIATAVLLVRLFPRVLAIPSPSRVYGELRVAHEALEQRDRDNSAALVRKSQELASENAERVRLENVSHAKTEFLSAMSHELRTPLNAILGFAQLLHRDKRDPLSERNRERVAHILRGGEHVLHLIDELLDLSRIESGTLMVALEPCPVSSTVEHVVRTLENLASAREVQLQLDADALISAAVVADRTRLAQILLNFGSNAIKYNRPNGEVRFEAYALETGRVRISVRDNGLGIPADKQDKLFRAFERAGREAGPIEGTGVGLFITKRLAELMHGAVGFSSTVDEGSVFWIDLPSATASS